MKIIQETLDSRFPQGLKGWAKNIINNESVPSDGVFGYNAMFKVAYYFYGDIDKDYLKTFNCTTIIASSVILNDNQSPLRYC